MAKGLAPHGEANNRFVSLLLAYCAISLFIAYTFRNNGPTDQKSEGYLMTRLPPLCSNPYCLVVPNSYCFWSK